METENAYFCKRKILFKNKFVKRMTKRIYSIILLVALSFLLISSCTNKAKTDETATECLEVAETDSVIDDDVIQQMIDSIQSKEVITARH